MTVLVITAALIAFLAGIVWLMEHFFHTFRDARGNADNSEREQKRRTFVWNCLISRRRY